MWEEFALRMVENVSPAIMRDHVDRLLQDILEFQADDCRLLQVHPEQLLRYSMHIKTLISYLKEPWQTWRKDPFDIDEDVLEELWTELPALQNSLIRQILLNHNLSSHPIIPYIIHDQDCRTLDELCDLSGLNDALVKTFLLNNAHFIDNEVWNYGGWHYRLVECLRKFLVSQLHGGIFHLEFRAQYIRTGRTLLRWFCRVGGSINKTEFSSDIKETLYQTLINFFWRPEISDIQTPEDFQSMDGVLNTLSNCNWGHVRRSEEMSFLCVAAILDWLSRYMNHPQSATNSQNLRDTIVRIYHGIFLPVFSHRFYSELLVYSKEHKRLLSLSVFPPPCAEILKEEDVSALLSDVPAYCLNPDFYFLSQPIYRMTHILTEAKYPIPITLSAWFTHVTELYLHMLVKYEYKVLRDVSQVEFPKEDFNLLLLHARPTAKMLLALRAILYLRCSMREKGWLAPSGFGMFATELLKKFDLDPRESLKFDSILEDLRTSEDDSLERLEPSQANRRPSSLIRWWFLVPSTSTV
ncbi:hypothetical protein GALMADRAFT_784334 [Galerina marginata CBS 339.88]|uniref:Uncharacterized protein n=1 Tax=Galerina marginata (strain CBS 339.88) TaxID=685588 RepID=A0A067SPE6_GALM3|nr:hypothetical protein GALMADRAFT_784334 [Galerina marginata CBS 339.88]